MAKKKEEQVFEIPKLSKDEYWEWRTTIAEMNTAKEKLRVAELTAKVMAKEAELLQARTQLHICNQVRSAREESDATQAEYARFKKALEDRLGISLSGKAIDDVTFEVRELPIEQ